jgi:diguanylate cyclase (GGDEF)-like protein
MQSVKINQIEHGPQEDSALPSVLKKLGVMTAIRDTYLVEQSLLRTLGPLLGVLETAFYRVDDRGGIARALYHSRQVTHKDDSQSVTEKIIEVTNEVEIEKPVSDLIDHVRMLGRGCARKTEGGTLLICYPVFGKNEQMGYFVFRRDREVTPVEEAVIHGILEVFTNYFDLLDISQRDQLTGLFNRHSLESSLDRLWNILSARMHEAEKVGTQRTIVPESYWLCVLDIDHFKSINDSFGHIIGDEVLILVARLLQKSLRQSDLLYRYGGEEFIAIAAAANEESATHIFERARSRIEKFKFPQVGHITISGGFCRADPGILPQTVVGRADNSLYAAKEAGRNRIYFYDALVKEGVLKEVPTGSVDLF